MTSLSGFNAFAYMARTLVEINQNSIADAVFKQIVKEAMRKTNNLF